MRVLLKLSPELEALQQQELISKVKCCINLVTGQQACIARLPGHMTGPSAG